MNAIVGGRPTAAPASAPLQDELTRAARRLVVLDDQGKVRASLAAFRERGERFKIIAPDRRHRDIVDAAKSLEPDLLIMDLTERRASQNAENIRQLKRFYARLPVLIFTLHAEDEFIDAALGAGADGYLLKSDSPVEVVTAVRSLLQGKCFLSPAICRRVIRGYVGARALTSPAQDSLTKRERQVIQFIAAGYRNRDIAEQLSLSLKTIEKHRGNLMRKLGLRSAAAVAAYAIGNGYLRP